MYKYIGTDGVKVSTVNQEIVPEKPEHWTVGYRFYKLSFYNKTACHVIINNGEQIYLDAEQGFESVQGVPITSFIIVESGVNYQWIGVV